MVDFIPVARPHMWGNEKAYVSAAIDEGWISSKGSYIDRLESAFAAEIGVAHAVAVANGTVALHLALDVLGVGEGDELIVPDFTMIAPIYAILYQRARPVPVDADATWNMDSDEVERRITTRTKAILAVHTYGHPARVDRLREIARKHGLALVEDGAEALGAEVGGQQVGSFGDIACFSLYANKVITTGEGGMLVTNDPEQFQAACWKRNMCFGPDRETQYTHASVGYNYRMTNLQAAVGVAQIENLSRATAAKIAIAERYDAALAGIPGLTLPPRSEWATNVHWVYGILVEEEFGVSRSELQRLLAEAGIETRRFFTPLHRQPIFRQHVEDWPFPHADRLWDRGLYIPSYIGMEDAVINRVATAIRRVHREGRA
ncbi:DegT/DnrJ/EryC1/StrS family aminotransferase [Sorangium sp. So ce1128]